MMSATPETRLTTSGELTPPVQGASVALAFDFGLKRIGVAVGQNVSGTATALETVAVRQQRVDWQAITQLVDTWRPDYFVVGRPASADVKSEFNAALEKFSRRLTGRFHRQVVFVDERLSSYAAAAEHQDTKRAGLDAIAARFILETWFMENPAPVDTA
jgi:putative Holliday junction resolvase